MITTALGSAVQPPKKQKTKGKAQAEEGKEEADETVEMQEYKDWHKNAHHGGGDKGNESDEDDEDGHGHGQRIGCQTQ